MLSIQTNYLPALTPTHSEPVDMGCYITMTKIHRINVDALEPVREHLPSADTSLTFSSYQTDDCQLSTADSQRYVPTKHHQHVLRPVALVALLLIALLTLTLHLHYSTTLLLTCIQSLHLVAHNAHTALYQATNTAEYDTVYQNTDHLISSTDPAVSRHTNTDSQLPISDKLLTQWWNQQLFAAVELVSEIQSNVVRLLDDEDGSSTHDVCSQYYPLYYDNEVQHYWTADSKGHVQVLHHIHKGECKITKKPQHRTPDLDLPNSDSDWQHGVCADQCNFTTWQLSLPPQQRFLNEHIMDRLVLKCYACTNLRMVLGSDSGIYVGKRKDDEYHKSKLSKKKLWQADMIASTLFDTQNEEHVSMFFLDGLFDNWQVNRLLHTTLNFPSALADLFRSSAQLQDHTASGDTTLYDVFAQDHKPFTDGEQYAIDASYVTETLPTLSSLDALPTDINDDLAAFISSGGGGGCGWQLVCDAPARKHHNASSYTILSSGGGQGGGFRSLLSPLQRQSGFANNVLNDGASRPIDAATEHTYFSGGAGSGAGLQYWPDGHDESDLERKRFQLQAEKAQRLAHSKNGDWTQAIIQTEDRRKDEELKVNVGGGGGAGLAIRHSNNGDDAISQQHGAMSDEDQILPRDVHALDDLPDDIAAQMRQCLQQPHSSLKLIGGGGAGAGGSIKLTQQPRSAPSVAELSHSISNADINHRLEDLMHQWFTAAEYVADDKRHDDDDNQISWYAQLGYRFEFPIRAGQHSSKDTPAVLRRIPQTTHRIDPRNLNEHNSDDKGKPKLESRHSTSSNDQELAGTELAKSVQQCIEQSSDQVDWYEKLFCPCLNQAFIDNGYSHDVYLRCTG